MSQPTETSFSIGWGIGFCRLSAHNDYFAIDRRIRLSPCGRPSYRKVFFALGDMSCTKDLGLDAIEVDIKAVHKALDKALI
jgi:hypothetical protein